MTFQAIRNVHPNVVSVYDETEAKDKDGNIVVLDQSSIDAEIVRLQEESSAEQETKQQILASAKTKLENLGLTVEEIKEAFGI